ncbi:AraC family transcriptional regulator [Saccharibacillus sp. JS10]|uniref:AraC family transcriptional regulator n=1 Tax=Saccharibacillus sp. JS10 TaxID=2950552 RepID=UPI002109F3F5|nr:AraC family transcriptional regulator [Saccharibacillus sp. JS10]MCQ4085468.1 AraC family transcriptional regulator [Saccharibacillus sp. JS10]
MKPLRKPFVGDPLFPLELSYRTLKKTIDELPDHLHDRYEMVFIHSGHGIFFIDDAWYDKKAGDLFLIPGNTIHRSLPHDEDPIVSSVLFFAPSLLHSESTEASYHALYSFDWVRKNKTYRIELTPLLTKEVEAAFADIQSELEQRLFGSQEAIKLSLHRLLLQLNRSIHATQPDSLEQANSIPAWMRDALREIDEHPERANGLSTLAAKACISAPHFSRVFKQLTAMNVTQYVNAKRIVRSKELLLSTDQSIANIAQSCGYETTAHFHRMFKRVADVTPSQYRRSLKGHK